MSKKTLIPNDFRDFLSILSFMGFMAIFLGFFVGWNWLSDNMDGLFLILGGSAFLIVGKAFNIRKWLNDGLQRNEVSLLVSIVFGLSAVVTGLLILFGVTIPIKLYGFIGLLALVPAIYTFIDYIAKNKG